MSLYTLTYSEAVQGWTSFFSFMADWMIGMNDYFYTFKGGNIYKHNANEVRNNFYGTQYSSKLKSVFNDVPLENKLFKTLNLEGDDAWSATMITDLQNTGYIEAGWFKKKEQSWYAFVRNSGIPNSSMIPEYALRSMNGIGRSRGVKSEHDIAIIRFSINPLVSIGDIISVGDYLYFSVSPYTTPQFAGIVINIRQDYPNGYNDIKIDTSVTGAVEIGKDPYFMYVKNSVAESQGVLGHYCVFELENLNTDKVELFSVESEVMKSYP